MPGRVGDSPIVGGGLYVDPKVGAAGATGTGENILRYCGSFLAVEKMRQGATPEQALREVIGRIAEGEQRPPSELSINFLAIDQQGNFAAVGTDADYQISVVIDGEGSRQPAIRIV
jgi:N4-(beta-N-acetylglucosaminyl)-L-asparaginase